MSQSQEYTAKPAMAADISSEWIAQVREILARDGQACRAGFPALTIEVQNINLPEVWQPLNLPANTAVFATAPDRDQVLDQLWSTHYPLPATHSSP